MYYPYLRGKQFELIALRELVDEGLISKKVIPIIEPVTLSATLISTMKTFIEKDRQIAIIKNPAVGSFLEEYESIDDFNEKDIERKRIKNFVNIEMNNFVIPSYICDENTDYHDNKVKDELKDSILILNNADVINDIFENIDGKLFCIPDERIFRRTITNNRILLSDNFKKRPRNADYEGEEVYSDDHLFYKEEGYEGFSDYSIIGADYSESGFAPFAIAIHIVYFDQNNILRIIHFRSDSNKTPNNPANKYYEAVQKLKEWYTNKLTNNKDYTKNHIHSAALEEFIDDANTGNYSGLGVIKKISIKHHLELMSRFLDEVAANE
jgi:hypothetical protein